MGPLIAIRLAVPLEARAQAGRQFELNAQQQVALTFQLAQQCARAPPLPVLSSVAIEPQVDLSNALADRASAFIFGISMQLDTSR